jgi:phenylacetic acid degradation operon negative regulatory protein
MGDTMGTTVSDTNTGPDRGSRGRAIGQVAFLFGLTGREQLSGVQLRRMLNDLGTSPDAARALLARMVRTGLLTSHRDGRTTAYALAGSFLAGFARVRDQAMTRPTPWDGHFFALLYAVPEEHRAFRDALRRAALLSGYGLLQPGVLVALTDRRHVLAELLASAPGAAQVRAVTLGMGVTEAAEVAATAWNLPALAQTFRDHIAALDATAAEPEPTTLHAYVHVLQPALTDTLREPALDPALLPPDWPGPALREAFDRFERRHAAMTERYLREVLDPAARSGSADAEPDR